MVKSHIKLGRFGEDIAANYLHENNYFVIGRNYRKTYGEIDIIARSLSGILVFVEVKALRRENVAGLRPEDHMTPEKVKKLVRVCEEYANRNPDVVGKKGWRIDLIAISIPPDDLTDYNKNCVINHYENVLGV